MTHDPLCPCQSHRQPLVQLLSGACHYCERDVICECDLIAKVRADEREQSVQRVKDFQTSVLSGLSFYPMSEYMDGLIEKAIRGEQP
jgi:hypothetical protein